jgi:cytochrome c oxidase subunit 3
MYYVFSGVHAFHLLGGIGALIWLTRKAAALQDGEEQPLRKHRAAARHVASYWHFMGALWLALFVLLLVWK